MKGKSYLRLDFFNFEIMVGYSNEISLKYWLLCIILSILLTLNSLVEGVATFLETWG